MFSQTQHLKPQDQKLNHVAHESTFEDTHSSNLIISFLVILNEFEAVSYC